VIKKRKQKMLNLENYICEPPVGSVPRSFRIKALMDKEEDFVYLGKKLRYCGMSRYPAPVCMLPDKPNTYHIAEAVFQDMDNNTYIFGVWINGKFAAPTVVPNFTNEEKEDHDEGMS
jgi:hypothetical protein